MFDENIPGHNSPFNNGDRVEFDEFYYTNKAGGTGSANDNPICDMDIEFTGTAIGMIIHQFWDYECGWRYHIKLEEKFWKLIKDKAKENRAFVSEHDLRYIWH